MKRRPRCRWAHWRIDNVMFNLRRGSDHYDLVLEKRAVGIVGMPKFWIENFVERACLECVERCKANHMATKIIRHVALVTHLRDSARGQRFINFLARLRRLAGECAILHAISCSADFSCDWIPPEIHESDAIVQQLRGWNERIVWGSGLRSIFHIEIGAEHDFVAIAIERGVKWRIAIVRGTENQVEHDETRARREQSIDQKSPDFTSPRE